MTSPICPRCDAYLKYVLLADGHTIATYCRFCGRRPLNTYADAPRRDMMTRTRHRKRQAAAS